MCTSRASDRPSKTTPRSRAASSRCAAAAMCSPRFRTEPMHRLYLKIYVTVIASLVLVVLVAGGVWRWGSGGPPGAQVFEVAGEIASLALPPSTAPQPEQQRVIAHLAQRFRSALALYPADGTLIAAFGRPLPPPMNSDG